MSPGPAGPKAARAAVRDTELVAPRAEPVPSPCISVCRMDDASGLCSGCLRTLDEIAGWSTFDEPAKRAVWRRLAARRVEARCRREAPAAPEAPSADAP